MRQIFTVIIAFLLVPAITKAQQYQQMNDIPYTESTDTYAQDRCKLDVYYPTGLVGHKDVTLYEMQGFDHGAMAQPAYHILKSHIQRLTGHVCR